MSISMSAHIARAARLIERAKNRFSAQHRKEIRPFSALRKRYFSELWKTAAKSINAEIEDVGYGYFRIKKGKNSTYVNKSDVMLDNHLSLRLAGNKPFIHKLLEQNNLPVPKNYEFDLTTIYDAYDFLNRSATKFAVKPAGGTGGGAGVTTNISTYKNFKKAALKAAAYNQNLLAEEHINGNSFRLIYLNGKLIDAIQRNPPVICGDGQTTIRKLISQENLSRLKSDQIIALSPITIDSECQQHLHAQGYSLRSKPGDGEIITAKAVVNQNTCKENLTVLDEVHPSYYELGNEINNFFKLELLGLDLITNSVSVPLSDSGGVINELNTTPGLHHHSLIADESAKVPVAEIILNHILSK